MALLLQWDLFMCFVTFCDLCVRTLFVCIFLFRIGACSPVYSLLAFCFTSLYVRARICIACETFSSTLFVLVNVVLLRLRIYYADFV